MSSLVRATTIGAVTLAFLAACRGSSDHAAPVAISSASNGAPTVTAPRAGEERQSLHAMLPRCQWEQYGLFFDRGGLEGLAEGAPRASKDPVRDLTSQGGAGFERVRGGKLPLRVWLERPSSAGAAVTFRVRGVAARHAQLWLDGKLVGTSALPKDGPGVVSFAPFAEPLPEGPHLLEFRFPGKKTTDDVRAEVDWIHLREPDAPRMQPLPTEEDVAQEHEVGGERRAGIALRSGARLSCPIEPQQALHLSADLAFWGEGSGTFEVRLLQDGELPVTLQQRKVSSEEKPGWLHVDVPIEGNALRPAALELRVLEASRGGRVVIGEPTLVRPSGKRSWPAIRNVVVVVQSTVSRQRIPPWAAAAKLDNLGRLARVGATFPQYRSSGTAVTTVMASLLTGVGPERHGVTTSLQRLPASRRTVVERLRQAGVRTAMFTAVPTSFADFGFQRGWDQFVELSPVEDHSSAEPFDRALGWLRASGIENRHLVVLHVAGAHPPWDVTPEDFARLPPAEYGGSLQPRRAAMVFNGARRSTGHGALVAEEDWVRYEAVLPRVLRRQDEGLGRLLRGLEQDGLWDSTLIVVVGDVAEAARPTIPFEPGGQLSEERLAAPLIVRFPDGYLAGLESTVPVGPENLGATFETALGVVPNEETSRDLFRLLESGAPIGSLGRTAFSGQSLATRMEMLVLRSEAGAEPNLCALEVDPACVNNAFDSQVVGARVMWIGQRETELRLGAARAPQAQLSARTGAALTVWGDWP